MALSTAFGACGEDEETTTRTVTSSPFTQETAEGKPAVPKPTSKADAVALSGIDESIETYGHLATLTEEKAIVASLRTFMSARAAARYKDACGLLIAYTRRTFDDCPGSLRKLFGPIGQELLDRATRMDIALVKVDGREAYVTYSTPGVRSQIMYMKREGGQWKVGKVNADRLL